MNIHHSLKSRWVLPLGLGLLWLLFLLVLAIWSARSERVHVSSMAEREARAFFQQVVVTRAWNTAHGGVYVLSTPGTPPNKYLPEDDRTVETVQGLTLTKVNPAYMTRQISSITRDDHEVQFHITSLDPINPANKADDWEGKALAGFETGERDRFELVSTPSGQLFRYMAPLYTEKRCMRCHARYGHQDKTILGGISVSFAAAPLIQTRKDSVAQSHIAFSLIFLVGFVGICGSTYQIQRKREEAEKADRAKSIFLANMSHDMRTPLNGIMGMTELMQKKGLGPVQSRYADMVRHSAWTLLEIITDITDFSRLESGRLELSEKVFDIHELLDDTLNIFRFESANKGLSLSGSVRYNVPRLLKGDAFRLKQIMANLVGNAVKFTPSGSVTVRIATDSIEHARDEIENVRLKVEVEDTGIGIPVEEQHDIFNSFRQVDDSYAKQHEGSGLGLAICNQLVTMMGGSISVQSAPDTGSTFFFEVVLSLPDEGETVEAVTEGAPADVPETPPRRVLVVEDNPLNQTFAMEILDEAGHPVTLASNGVEAIDALRDNEFDIVFMDVQMPEMDGLEATRRIRNGEAGAHAQNIPIVAATAFAVRGDREACLAAGMNGYVVKPLTSSDLLMAVAVHTGQLPHPEKEPEGRHPFPPEEIIDMENALKRLGGRRDLFHKLANTFLEDVPPKVDNLALQVASGEMDEVLRLAHGLKSSASMIQADAMSEAAFALEMAVREERLTAVPELFDRLRSAAEAAILAVARMEEA